jgi:hypothetical protein
VRVSPFLAVCCACCQCGRMCRGCGVRLWVCACACASAGASSVAATRTAPLASASAGWPFWGCPAGLRGGVLFVFHMSLSAYPSPVCGLFIGACERLASASAFCSASGAVVATDDADNKRIVASDWDAPRFLQSASSALHAPASPPPPPPPPQPPNRVAGFRRSVADTITWHRAGARSCLFSELQRREQ